MIYRTKKNHLLLLIRLSASFILLSSLAYSQGSVVEARVTSVTGIATVSGNGRGAVKLATKQVLSPGDEVDTTGGGRVVIDLSDGSQVVVLPGSRLVFGDYRNAGSIRELLQIVLGRIRVKINHFQGKPNPYRVRSPTASIAVRGTEFTVSVEPLGETRVVVLEGSVEVASLLNPSKKFVAEPRRGVLVRADSTIEFFVADVLSKEVGDREREKPPINQKGDNDNGSSRTATNVYERTLEAIVESGETALPSRFTAFPDAHLDSLDNPAYAGGFSDAEGRVNFVPSINGSTNAEDDLRARFGLRSPRPLDFSFVPTGSIFVPIRRFRAVVGGSFGYHRNGLQSLSATGDFSLPSPPFPAGVTGLRTITGATTGNLFSGSLIIARNFGSNDRTSVGFGVERLFSVGNLNETNTLRDATGLSLTEQVASRSAVDRTRVTFGVKHDFGTIRFGAYYRFGKGSGTDSDFFRYVNGVSQPTDLVRTGSTTSEIGFRLRGAFSRRLFYGAEANLLFAGTRENLRRAGIVDSTERDRTNRATLGFGLGFVWRPRTIFSFDVAGGLIGTNQRRTENLTGNLLETEHQHARFLSLHAAVQTDIWKNLFVSASLLSITQSRTTDSALFPDRFGRLLNSDGQFMPSGRTKDLYTDFYSNYGIGWRFKPNLILQYLLTTDYGQTSPRHTFLLRYTFDFKRK